MELPAPIAFSPVLHPTPHKLGEHTLEFNRSLYMLPAYSDALLKKVRGNRSRYTFT